MASQRALRDLNTSPRALRTPSLSSDVQSTRSAAMAAALPETNPPPAFVACAEASQLVSSEADDSINVKDQALVLLNSFLDQILYNILSTAQSTHLGRLRSAVPVVLKPRLGKAALKAADEELNEYLNDGDDEALKGIDARFESRNDFNLDLAWKLTRLRCMVYTRLGDMEEEDEEEYIELEQLHPGSLAYSNAAYRASSIKAASAIFLTSILEYLGEQALLYAVQNTQKRAQAPKSPVSLQLNENGPMSPPIHQSMVLDEVDMFYVGRESPLSRLWRAWRAKTRSPVETLSSQAPPMQDTISHEGSPIADRTHRIEEDTAHEEVEDAILPHQIPLPTSLNDVNEIEIPGLAREIVDDGGAALVIPVLERSKRRPVSLEINKSDTTRHPSPESSQRNMTIKQKRRSRPILGHKRSMSHPVPAKSIFSTTADYDKQDKNKAEDVLPAKDQGLEVNNTDLKSHNTSGSSDDHTEAPQNAREKGSSAGLVATTVSVIAGALGVGALASAGQTQSSGEKGTAESQPRPARTVADEMIGTTPQVGPPKDAVTGSSIKSVHDFDNLHIPVEKPKLVDRPENNSRLDFSDPEDLALSSGDDDGPKRNAGGTAKDLVPSADNTVLEQSAMPHELGAMENAASEMAPTDELGNMSKSASRQGTVFTTSQKPPKIGNQVVSQYEPDRPLYVPVAVGAITEPSSNHHIVTMPVTSPPSATEKGINKAVVSTAYAQPEKDRAGVVMASRPGTANTTIYNSVPHRMSSDRARSGHAHTDSRTSHHSQHSNSSSSSNKLLGITKDGQDRPQTATSHGPVTNGTLSSTSANPPPGREVWSDKASSTRNPLQVQTDTASQRDIDQAEATKKSLEILIRGDETLHYTLTPVSARAENFPLSVHSASRDVDITDMSRNVSSIDGPSAAHRSVASSNSVTVNGLRANPVNDMAAASNLVKDRDGTFQSSVGGTAQTSSSPAKLRTNRAQPRDPRLDNTTMLDLADYARSTGPENEQQLPKALTSRPGTSTTVKTVQSTSNSVRTMPAPPMPTTRPSTIQTQSSKNVGARARFQPREARVARRSGTNDLIDFLREGPPPNEGDVNGNAPNGTGRVSAASTRNSSAAPRSIQESTKSSTALLASNRAQPKKSNGVNHTAATASRQVSITQGDTMPARKQRRMRDPYAIDDSDDELEEPQNAVSARRTQDESLIDFLRNTQPPPGSSSPPVLTSSSKSVGASSVRRQLSNQGIRGKIMRSASKSSLNRKVSVSNSRTATKTNEPPQYYRSAGNARETSPHLVQTGKKIDIYKPTTVTHASHVDRKRAQKVARSPTSTGRTGTADLADYLKKSGPPVIQGGPVQESSIVKEEAGFLKFFSRRKAMK